MSHSEYAVYKGGMMMKKLTNLLGSALLVLASSTLATASQKSGAQYLIAADNCFAVGQAIAADRGVTLVAAEATVQNGQNVCKIVVLAPATNGGRPKREILYVPQ